MSDRTHRSFLIPLKVVNAAARDGIKLPELQDMLRRSARVTHPDGNRRYHDVVFMVEGQRVVSYSLAVDPAPAKPDFEYQEEEDEIYHSYDCETCFDRKKVQVFNECPYCEGEGCKRCDEGLVPASIPCPTCTKAKKKASFNRRRR